MKRTVHSCCKRLHSVCTAECLVYYEKKKKADLDKFGLTWKGMTKFTFSPTTEMSLVLRWRGRRIFGCSVWWERWERKSKSEWVVWKLPICRMNSKCSVYVTCSFAEPQTREQIMGLVHVCCNMWFTDFSAGFPFIRYFTMLSNNSSVLCLKTHTQHIC